MSREIGQVCVCVCVCVYHTPVLYRNGCTEQDVFSPRRFPSTDATLYFRQIMVYPNIRVLPSENLFKTPDL